MLKETEKVDLGEVLSQLIEILLEIDKEYTEKHGYSLLSGSTSMRNEPIEKIH